MGGSSLLGLSAAHRPSGYLDRTEMIPRPDGNDISICRPAYPISISYGIDSQSARVLRPGFGIFVQKSFFA
jgi:hypothetical protein